MNPYFTSDIVARISYNAYLFIILLLLVICRLQIFALLFGWPVNGVVNL